MADEILSQAEIEALIAGAGAASSGGADPSGAAQETAKPAKKGKNKAEAQPEAQAEAPIEAQAEVQPEEQAVQAASIGDEVPFMPDAAAGQMPEIPVGAPQMQVNTAEQPRISVKTPHQDSSVRPMQFAPLSSMNDADTRSSVDLIMDVQLQVAVELGRTVMQVRDVLGLGPGSVVELDKHSGEPVEVVVNNKIVARGEVVVIDENFGVRITEIVNSKGRDVNLQAA